MTLLGKLLWVLAFAVLIALLFARTAGASLNTQYPTDEDGTVHVPQIDALISQLVGRPFAIDCVPHDPSLDDADSTETAGTPFTGEYTDDTETTVHWSAPTSSIMDGEECGALAQLLSPPMGFYKPAIVTHAAPVKKGGKKAKGASLVGVEMVWPNARVFAAAEALADLQHEAEHVIIAGSDGFTTPDADAYAPAFDEGLVECTAIKNVWNTIKLVTRVAWLRRDLLSDIQGVHQNRPPEYLTNC